MPARLKSLLSLAASVALAGGLLYLALRGADLAAVGDALAAGRWGWAVPFVAVALFSVVVRAWRWGLLLDALPGSGPRPTAGLGLLTASVAIGYLVNYAAPRVGEVARAANVSRQSRASFSEVLGTVVAERLLDVVALALVLLAVAVAYGDRLAQVWSQAADGLAAAVGGASGSALWIALALAALAVAGAAAWVWSRRSSGSGKLAEATAAFRHGLTTILNTGRTPALLGSTAVIWFCYALMTDLPFRILGMSAEYGLGLGDAWAVMAVGGIGMALPAPGGTGSFHYATVQALTLLFGVAATPAATYAILVHAAGVVFYCALGVAALVWQGTSVGEIRRSAPSPS